MNMSSFMNILNPVTVLLEKLINVPIAVYP